MDKILHDPQDPKLWELWYIPYNGSCRILSISSISRVAKDEETSHPRVPQMGGVHQPMGNLSGGSPPRAASPGSLSLLAGTAKGDNLCTCLGHLGAFSKAPHVSSPCMDAPRSGPTADGQNPALP